MRTIKSVRQTDVGSLTIDELWALHNQIGALLASKIQSEKKKLDARLAQLDTSTSSIAPLGRSSRRPYPKVEPKYRSISNPSLTWAGRGKVPRWLNAEIKAGKKLDDFRITAVNTQTKRRSNVGNNA